LGHEKVAITIRYTDFGLVVGFDRIFQSIIEYLHESYTWSSLQFICALRPKSLRPKEKGRAFGLCLNIWWR
jgi:hypothetical protein